MSVTEFDDDNDDDDDDDDNTWKWDESNQMLSHY